jgi:hypothetical protein
VDEVEFPRASVDERLGADAFDIRDPRSTRMLQIATGAFRRAAANGSRKMCEYVRAWRKTLANHDDPRFDPRRALAMLRHRASAPKVMAKICANVRSRVGLPVSFDYTGMFQEADKSGSYWISQSHGRMKMVRCVISAD